MILKDRFTLKAFERIITECKVSIVSSEIVRGHNQMDAELKFECAADYGKAKAIIAFSDWPR